VCFEGFAFPALPPTDQVQALGVHVALRELFGFAVACVAFVSKLCQRILTPAIMSQAAVQRVFRNFAEVFPKFCENGSEATKLRRTS